MARRSRWQSRSRVLLGLLSFGTLLLVYSIVSNLPGANHVITPPPQEILGTLAEGLADGAADLEATPAGALGG